MSTPEDIRRMLNQQLGNLSISAEFAPIPLQIDLIRGNLDTGNTARRAFESTMTREQATRIDIITNHPIIRDEERRTIEAMQAVRAPEGFRYDTDLLPFYRAIAARFDRKDQMGNPTLTAEQVFTIALHHPDFGYYQGPWGISKSTATITPETSAFNTPMEIDPDARQAYVKGSERAFKALDKMQRFTPQKPFLVFLVGDGEGSLLDDLLHKSWLTKSNTAKIVLIDSSATLSGRQLARTKPKEQEKIILHQMDAVDLGSLMRSEYPGQRGVIITEENLDTFATRVMQRADKNLAVESAVRFSPDKATKIQLLPSGGTQALYSAWKEAFPHYATLFTQLNSQGPHMPINHRAARMIQNITATNFSGYWLGSDYCGYFMDLGEQQQPATYPSVRAMPIPAAGMPGKHDYTVAIRSISDVSADVDPALLQFATVNGMRLDFAGRAGQFPGAMRGESLITRQMVRAQLDQIARLKSEDQQRKAMITMINRYSGARFSWALASADVPPLVNPNNAAKAW